jgi:hypothetical protein
MLRPELAANDAHDPRDVRVGIAGLGGLRRRRPPWARG